MANYSLDMTVEEFMDELAADDLTDRGAAPQRSQQPTDWADLLDMEEPPPPAPPLPQPARATASSACQTEETLVIYQADRDRSLHTAEDILNRETDVERLTILVGRLHGPSQAALFQAMAAYQQQLARAAAVGRRPARGAARGRDCLRAPTDGPNSRKRALEALDDGVLAASTRGPMESRRKTWEELCRAWDEPAWPITTDNLQMVAASLKAGGYQSAQLYFDAAVWYQSHVRQEPVLQHLRKLIKAYVRSITRTGFPEQLESAIDLTTADQPYNPADPHHAADAVVMCTW